MKLGEPALPSPEGGFRRPAERAAVERAVMDFQRGADREASFEVLFRRFRPRIERFLARRVFSPDERLDLTQEIFLRIYQGLEGYRGEGSLDAWILQITFNAYRKWRDRQPGGAHAVREIACDPSEVPEPSGTVTHSLPGSGAVSPLDEVLGQERRVALRGAIEQLPRKQRHCVELKVYQDRSVKEIAVALRISPETVKVHLFQARHRLGDLLAGFFGTLEF